MCDGEKDDDRAEKEDAKKMGMIQRVRISYKMHYWIMMMTAKKNLHSSMHHQLGNRDKSPCSPKTLHILVQLQGLHLFIPSNMPQRTKKYMQL